MRPQLFHVPFGHHTLAGDITPPGSQPQFLLLHGAGQSRRGRFDVLRSRLANDGTATCAFDMTGQGETGGQFEGSSLHDRTNQALAVIHDRALPGPLTVLGASMGAYTALKLTEQIQINRLILFAPAAYDAQAYDTPFGPEFSRLIRRPGSWQDTDAWAIISRFTGRLLIVTAELDNVIPAKLPPQLLARAGQAASKKLITIPGSPHATLPFLSDPANRAQFDAVYTEIMALIKAT
jgi:uncharacterized protein